MIKRLYEKYNTIPVQIKATFWFLICSFLQKGISVITTPVFTRLLSTEEYGQYSVFNSWLNILTVVVTLRLCNSVYMQGLIKFESKRKEYSSSLQGLTLFLVLIWSSIYFIFHDFWNQVFSLTTVQMMAMLLMMWATAAFGFWSAEQRVAFRYQKMVILTILVSVAKPLVGVIFVILAEDKATARILGLMLVEVVGYTGLFLVQMKRGKVFFVKKFWFHALAYNIPLLPHYLSQTVLNSADKIMIEDLVGKSAAGIYGLAYSISQVMMLFNSALGQTLNPWEYQKIKTGKVDSISQITYPTMVIIAGANLFLIAFAPELVSFFAPKSYYEAIWVIPPVAMSVYFIYTYERFAKLAFYYEKTKIIALTTALSAALNVILNYIFIPIYGYYAAGYTTLICYLSVSVFHYFLMRKMCQRYLDAGYLYDTKTLVLITGAFMILGFIYVGLYQHIIIRYLLTGVLLIIIFLKRKIIINSIRQVLLVKKNRKSTE